MPKPLKTNRLLLRAFTPSDAPALYAYASDPRVGPMAGWKPHESVEESARIIEHFIRTDEVWAIVEQETGALIGSIGLHSSQKEGVHYDAELGYVLAAPYWGRGLMAEAAGRVMQAAFEELGMQSLCVSHFDGNTQSKRVIEKCGFHFFKRLEDSFERYDGKKLGENVYLLTKEQYESQKISD